MRIRIEIGPLDEDNLEEIAGTLFAILVAIPDGAPAPVIVFVDDEDDG